MILTNQAKGQTQATKTPEDQVEVIEKEGVVLLGLDCLTS